MSASNCATSFHRALGSDNDLPKGWQFDSRLNHKHVYDGFVIISLFRDHQSQNLPHGLIVPHGGPQKDRFLAAMIARNTRIRLYGQPELKHRCKKCVRLYAPTKDKRMSKS